MDIDHLFEAKKARLVIEWIKSKDNPGVTARDLAGNHVANIGNAQDAKKILEVLSKGSGARGHWKSTEKTQGRKGKKFFLFDVA